MTFLKQVNTAATKLLHLDGINAHKSVRSCNNLFSLQLLYGVIHVSDLTINAVYVLNQFFSRVTHLVLKGIINWQCW